MTAVDNVLWSVCGFKNEETWYGYPTKKEKALMGTVIVKPFCGKCGELMQLELKKFPRLKSHEHEITGLWRFIIIVAAFLSIS